MPNVTQVFVTVPEGREVPIPASESRAGGAGAQRCKPKREDGKVAVYVLPWSTYTRRRINAGDLVLSKRDGKPAKDSVDASAPDEIKLTHDGSVADDQRTDDVINAAADKAAAEAAIMKAKAESARASITNPTKGQE